MNMKKPEKNEHFIKFDCYIDKLKKQYYENI